MANGILLKRGSGFDSSGLTAVPSNVKEGKVFLGSESKGPGTGEMTIASTIEKKMAVNETYNISPGYHNGQDRFFQEDVTIKPGEIIDPGAGGIAIKVTGTYRTSDTIVMSVENLRPEVIKDGVRIGDITGNYQGFPDEE